MEIGFIGLGKMGSNMVQRLLNYGHKVTVFDRDPLSVKKMTAAGASAAESVEKLIDNLPRPAVVWVMVPSGEITDSVIRQCAGLMKPDDIIIDGGNSYYKDTVARSALLSEKGISLIDSGTSGGIWGLKEGYCLMIGGPENAFRHTEPLYKSLAPDDGYIHTGPSGSGHFVKMIHNGIEYGLMEAYAEGFEIMNNSENFKIDLMKVSRVWQKGSVVRSWLLDLLTLALEKEGDLASVRDYVEDSGEGRWTVMQTIEEGTPAPVIALSLMQRFRSRQKESFAGKVLAALRNEFGGHEIHKKGE
ncbi:MAG: decarboxylating 6-phosphogluconate dehydrogenase [Spirochaetes bacterium]|nr:decarboxylating 6-phosphogluconate dehydrogenase [Spirochaetota bacterium]